MALNFPPAPIAFFALNNRSGTPQLQIYSGGERISTGSTFSSAETGTSGDLCGCRVILFGNGENTLIAMQRSGIYRTTDLGNNWTLVHTLTNVDSSACKSGLYTVTINGVNTLCGFYRDASTSFRGVTSTDGVNWTNVVLSGATSPSFANCPHSCVVYRNKVFCIQTGENRILVYDPGSGSITTIPNASIPNCNTLDSAGLTICGGNLYVAYRDNSGFLSLAKFQAGRFTNKFTTNITVSTGSGKWGVWTFTSTPIPQTEPFDPFIPSSINEEINVLAHRSSGGWGAYQFNYNPTTDTFAVSDFTSTAIPALMTSAGTGSSVGLYLDNNVSPGAVRDMFVFFNTGSGTNWNLYRWNGPQRMGKWSDLSANVPLGVFANNSDALPFIKTVNGSYSAALLRVNITSRTYVSGGIRFTFTINAPQFTGQLAKVFAFWGTKNLTLPNGIVAALTDTSHGTITGNIITDLAVDGTEYQVTWAAEADGLSQFDPFKIIFVAQAQ